MKTTKVIILQGTNTRTNTDNFIFPIPCTLQTRSDLKKNLRIIEIKKKN